MAGMASAWGAAQPIGHGHPAGHRPPATGLRPSPSPGDRAEAHRFHFIGGRAGPLGHENHPGGSGSGLALPPGSRNAKAVATTDTICASRLQEVRAPSRRAGLVAMLLNTRPVLQGGGRSRRCALWPWPSAALGHGPGLRFPLPSRRRPLPQRASAGESPCPCRWLTTGRQTVDTESCRPKG
jgi:hypothetical protein